jgi:hypothetical protein
MFHSFVFRNFNHRSPRSSRKPFTLSDFVGLNISVLQFGPGFMGYRSVYITKLYTHYMRARRATVRFSAQSRVRLRRLRRHIVDGDHHVLVVVSTSDIEFSHSFMCSCRMRTVGVTHTKLTFWCIISFQNTVKGMAMPSMQSYSNPQPPG